MTERELLDAIVEHAKATGWLVMHARPAIGKGGRWQTALQGHVGFPDLVLVHEKRRQLIFAELKSEKGDMGPGQWDWLQALAAAGTTAVVWRPSDLRQIVATLYGRAVAA